jgi:hypothetical protein
MTGRRQGVGYHDTRKMRWWNVRTLLSYLPYFQAGFVGFTVNLKFYAVVLRGICGVLLTNCSKPKMICMNAYPEQNRDETPAV